MRLQRTIKSVVRPGEESGFVAECVEIPVVTQGATLDETVANLREAVQLHLEGEDLAEMGLAPDPTLVVTMELEPLHAWSAPHVRPRCHCGAPGVWVRGTVTEGQPRQNFYTSN